MNAIIVDTSALYALADRNDPHHLRAAAFLRAQSGAHTLWVSNHVFDETMTLTKVRLGMHACLQMGVRLRNSRLIDLVVFGQEEEQMTWRLFSQFTDKAWSYTDCASLALSQLRDVRQVFAFDHHFVQMGLRMLPE
ncbi:MAG: type II toxin-antitoxin system VapC family toxin [Caldilineales bacterium]|nr:type II toxin-antitoxin system VapC family toxin [Caldilineales bacterium]